MNGRGRATLSVIKNFERRLIEQGLRAAVSLEAAGAAGDRAHTLTAEPLRCLSGGNEFGNGPANGEDHEPGFRYQSAKGKHHAANRWNSSAERQAVEEMRKKISELFAEQRRDSCSRFAQ